MGFIRNNLLFFLGTGCGIYIAQNYDVPNIKKVMNAWVLKAKMIEEAYRKPKKKAPEYATLKSNYVQQDWKT